MSAPLEVDLSIPFIDRNQFDMVFEAGGGGDSGRAMLQELFELFKQVCLERLESLEAVCRDKDLGELRLMIHYVSGSAGNLGMARLHNFCATIEAAIHEQQFDPPPECAKIIRAAFESTCTAFEQELN